MLYVEKYQFLYLLCKRITTIYHGGVLFELAKPFSIHFSARYFNKQSIQNSHISVTHQAVPLYSLAQSIVVFCFQQQAIRHVLDEVQVFVSGDSLLSLLRGSPSLIGGAFQVILEVHGDDSGQEIVHHNNTDILTACLNAIQSIKLRQQGALVLVYILKGRGNRQKKKKKIRHLN